MILSSSPKSISVPIKLPSSGSIFFSSNKTPFDSKIISISSGFNEIPLFKNNSVSKVSLGLTTISSVNNEFLKNLPEV